MEQQLQEENDEEEMAFGENEEDSEEMMDLSDLPTSLFACTVHEAMFDEDRQQVSVCLCLTIPVRSKSRALSCPNISRQTCPISNL